MNTLLCRPTRRSHVEITLVISVALCTTHVVSFPTTNPSSGKACVQVVPNSCVEVGWYPILFEDTVIILAQLAQKP
jgi:hypothetical protein